MLESDKLAAQAHDVLCTWLEELDRAARTRVVFAAAKHIAAIALVLEYEAGLPCDEALDSAARAVQARLTFSPGSSKTNRSEALAILQFGLTPVERSRFGLQPSRPALFAAVLRINVVDARRARAAALRGARGGRPGSGHALVLAKVRELMRKSVRDPRAAHELQLIRSELVG